MSCFYFKYPCLISGFCNIFTSFQLPTCLGRYIVKLTRFIFVFHSFTGIPRREVSNLLTSLYSGFHRYSDFSYTHKKTRKTVEWRDLQNIELFYVNYVYFLWKIYNFSIFKNNSQFYCSLCLQGLDCPNPRRFWRKVPRIYSK